MRLHTSLIVERIDGRIGWRFLFLRQRYISVSRLSPSFALAIPSTEFCAARLAFTMDRSYHSWTGQAVCWNALSIFDSERACDVVWETLVDVFRAKDIMLEDSMRSIERQDKAVGHHRETLLALQANCKSALRQPELIEKLYRSLDDKLRGKLEAFLPDQWSFKTFMQFFSRELAYIDAMHVIKIGPDVPPVTKNRS